MFCTYPDFSLHCFFKGKKKNAALAFWNPFFSRYLGVWFVCWQGGGWLVCLQETFWIIMDFMIFLMKNLWQTLHKFPLIALFRDCCQIRYSLPNLLHVCKVMLPYRCSWRAANSSVFLWNKLCLLEKLVDNMVCSFLDIRIICRIYC